MFTAWDYTQPHNWLWRLIAWVGKYHVYVMIDEIDRWAYINADTTGLKFGWLHVHYGKQMLENRDVVAVFETEIRETEQLFGWLAPFSCVTVTKRVLGINKWRIITPRQLMRELNGI